MTNTNLFSPEYTQGNLVEIAFITKIVGRIAVVAISLVGFGIVISSVLTNAFHGLYAVSPKFWDKVDDAKQATLGFNIAEGGNQIMQVMGSIQIMLLSFLPNIKAMTKFADEPLDIKAYFMKAIPLMCVSIFVGVFIFFSYPAQLAEKFSDFGRGLFDVVLTNVDPTAWVEALPTKMFILDLSTDGGLTDEDKAINKITKSVYKTYVGELSDMTKEKRAEVSKQIEQWIITNTNDYSTYTDTDKYSMKVSSRISVSEPEVSKANSEKDGVRSFAYYATVDTWTHGSAKNTNNLWIRYDVIFSPVAQKGNRESVDCVMTVSSTSTKGATNKVTITLNSSTVSITDSGGKGATGIATTTGGNVKVYIKVTGSTIAITPQVTAGSTNVLAGMTEITQIGGLSYVYGTGKHPIRTIALSSSGTKGSPTFSAIDASLGISNWTWGSSPTDGATVTKTTTGTGGVLN